MDKSVRDRPVIELVPISTHKKFKNLITSPKQRFGKLIVVEYAGIVRKNRSTVHYWKCSCDCGNDCYVSTRHLTGGYTKSCGCIAKNHDWKKTHNLRHIPEYDIWRLIKSRCYNQNNKSYKDYGGRGIKMSDEWKNSFADFIVDMGKRPTNKNSIDRIDNNRDYCFENCRWSTAKEQGCNKRNNIVIEFNGQTLTASQWADKLNIKYRSFVKRLEYMSPEDAITTPMTKVKIIYQIEPHTKIILNEFESVKVASEVLKIGIKGIQACLSVNSKRITSGNFMWCYKENWSDFCLLYGITNEE